MNPDTNKLEPIFEEEMENQKEELERRMSGLREQIVEATAKGQLVRADGSPVPKHWSTFHVDEHVIVKNYTFKVAYIGEGTLLLEPVGPVIVGDSE